MAQLVDKSGIFIEVIVVTGCGPQQREDKQGPGRLISLEIESVQNASSEPKEEIVKRWSLCAFSRTEIVSICIQQWQHDFSVSIERY